MPRLEAQKKEYEQIASNPNFWESKEDAKRLMRKLDDIKDQLDLVNTWKKYLYDANASIELFSIEEEEEMIIESSEGLKKLSKKVIVLAIKIGFEDI